MTIPFVKMHGAGNDFVLVDDRAARLAIDEPAFVRSLALRPDGIGAEGVLFVRPSEKADFAMRFFNPDGGEADFCGNGARCIASFAYQIGAAKNRAMHLETRAGVLAAEILDGNLVRVEMPKIKVVRENVIVVGVPHVVIPVKDLASCDVAREGRAIRFSEAFRPAGTNVDFVAWTTARSLSLRTYERGVEGESFACGSGAVASAVAGVLGGALTFPVSVTTSRGFVLTVDGVRTEGGVEKVTLLGPVKTVFHGEMEV